MGQYRILYFTNTLGAGGAERQLLYLLRGLDRTRYAPAVLTVYGESHLAAHYKPDLEVLNIPVYSLEHGKGIPGRLGALARYAALMWRFRPHIVQGILHYANLIARVMRPFSPPHKLITSGRNFYLPGELRSERLTHWLDTFYVANSPHIIDQIRAEVGRPTAKMRMLPNAIPLEPFQAPTDPSFRAQHFPNAGYLMGVIGRIAEQKDHITLLRALDLSRAAWPNGLQVFFLGEESEPPTSVRVRAAIAEYGLNDVIHLLPKARDIAPYYHASNLTVLPSLFEGFPNVVLESFAAGKPALVSAAANGVNIVEHGRTGWVFPTGDAAALARMLESAWRTPPADLQQMGEQARAAVAPYTIPKLIENYTALYESLLGKRK